MKYCKLTNEYRRTYGGCQWGPGITHRTNGEGDLCDSGWIHVYTHPLLAVLLNPIHANFDNPKLWAVKTAGKTKTDRGLKVGKTVVTTVREIELPAISIIQKKAFGILVALEMADRWGSAYFVEWAENWLSGKDRTADAAHYAARDATQDADAAHYAARDATHAAICYAADAADAADAAYAATLASDDKLDLIAIAKQAMKIK